MEAKMELTPSDEESISYLYLIEKLLTQAFEQAEKANNELNRLNLNIWLNSCFEVLRDVLEIFPNLLSKEQVKGNSFDEKEWRFHLTNSKFIVTQNTELKSIRDKSIHGLQVSYQRKKPYNELSWTLLGKFIEGNEYFFKLIAENTMEMTRFLNALKSDINSALGFDFGEKLRMK